MTVRVSTTASHFHVHADPDKPHSRPTARIFDHAAGDVASLTLSIGGHEVVFFLCAEMRPWAEGVAAAFAAPILAPVAVPEPALETLNS
jgi:hypothetical protein